MRTLTIIVGLLLLVSCKQEGRLEQALYEAGDNKSELFKVLQHYKKNTEDSLKWKAACFLIENMPQHGSAWSKAMETFKRNIIDSDTLVAMDVQNIWWDELQEMDKSTYLLDLEHIKAEFLIDNIDKAFDVWNKSPWAADVDFDLFCNFILPYRFDQELLAAGWRDSLYAEFHPLLIEVDDMKTAFEILHDTIWKRLHSSYSSFPYTLDALTVRHVKEGACNQRAAFLGYTMRALGLPAALDCVDRWANYGHNGHCWVSLVTKQGTYSIYGNEHTAKINNRIDADAIEIEYPVPADYPLPVDFKKRYAKILRNAFAYQKENMGFSPFVFDISKEYGLCGNLDVDVEGTPTKIYLCTFSTKKGWTPTCQKKPENGKCQFSSLGDSVVYLAMADFDNKVVPLNNPVIVAGNNSVLLNPDKEHLREVTLNRKYPIIGKWINKWASMVGGRFEGSDNPSFRKPELLYRIDKMPVYHNEVKLQSLKPFRYVRFVAPADCDAVMSEIEFRDTDTLLTVMPGISTMKDVELSFDKNMRTHPEYKKGFIAGYDFGKSVRLSSIVYYPCNDDNFVYPGHVYELFYYDHEWISLGKQTAKSYSLTYKNVPDDALLYLKDCTLGKEERPFTYEGDTQVWW